MYTNVDEFKYINVGYNFCYRFVDSAEPHSVAPISALSILLADESLPVFYWGDAKDSGKIGVTQVARVMPLQSQ